LVWTDQPGSSSQSASVHTSILVEAIQQAGLCIDPWLAEQVKRRVQQFGDGEWQRLSSPGFDAISPARARQLLGAGFTLTEFLIAPACVDSAERGAICSLGALVSLMVVVCDRLLDAGVPVETILPPAEIAAGGGNASLVMVLLRGYFNHLSALRPDQGVLQMARRVVARMFEAEIKTVCLGDGLPFRFWLRKSALPFALMCLPVWTAGSHPGNRDHLRWLYQVGWFFGALDDAVDLREDLLSKHPNCWVAKGSGLSYAAARRVAECGCRILARWDSVVPRSAESGIWRATFLYNISGWLEHV
jgi:hypothetical protein